MKNGAVAFLLFFGCAASAFDSGCAASAPPASRPPPPVASDAPPAPTTPTASAAPVDPPAPPAATASAARAPAGEPPKPNPGFSAPAGFTWIDTRAGFALAAKDPSAPGEVVCEVIEVATKKIAAKITGKNTVAGGADPSCEQLSPAAHLVSIGNLRGMFWKNWQDKTTACLGVVAPDDATCVEDDVTPFMFQGPDGPPANLDLRWSKAVVNGTQKKVATIPRGLNRDGNTRKWWSVEYCSSAVAVIDDTKGQRTTIDATHGTVKSTRKSDGSPLCP